MITVSLQAIIAPGRPVENRLIFITIRGLRATDGSTLGGTYESHYTTTLNPFYSNATRVRLMAGEFLVEIPDETINQLVQYYSRQADLLNFCPDAASINPEMYASYRSRWVTAATLVGLLAGSSVTAKLQKRLGDLSIKREGAAAQLLRDAQEQLKTLTAILEDGGRWGRTIRSAVKGLNNPDTPVPARLWASTPEYEGANIPAANAKDYYFRKTDGAAQRRPKKGYRDL